MTDFVEDTWTPDPIRYLDQAAASAAGRAYKRGFLDALDVRPGQVVVDVGCGPGTDLPQLAERVGATGSVIGVDRDPAMAAEARRRVAAHPNVVVLAGDAYGLALDDGCADRARTDRVLQHLAEPGRVLAELRRVLRPGGVLGMAEPDWDTLVIADEDTATSRAFTRFVADKFRQGAIGRQLARLAGEAGFAARTLTAVPIVFRDFAAAEQILGLRRNTARAVRAGSLDELRAGQWLGRLGSRPFLACFTLFAVTAQAPD